MRRPSLFSALVSLIAGCSAVHALPSLTLAQDAGVASTVDRDAEASEPDEPTELSDGEQPGEGEAPDGAGEDEGAELEQPPMLEPPALVPLQLDAETTAVGPEKPAAEPAAPAAQVPAKSGWTAPDTMVQLHGYLRLRGGLLKDGALGHRSPFDRPAALDGQPNGNYDPFPFFAPADSVRPNREDSTVQAVEGGCGNSPGEDGGCGKSTQVTGDLRLRLKPEIHLSDDVRVKAWIDVLDNAGLGTTGYGPYTGYSLTDLDLGNAIRVRRAWGEARNRDLGELRFGRMGADWGLGILDNGGDRNGIDSDFSSDVDRVMAISNLAGFYLMAAYDWASQGLVLPGAATPSGVPVDRAQRDDLSALTVAVAHRVEEEVQQSMLQRGDAVFNYGAYFVWRRQRLKLDADVYADSLEDGEFGSPPFVRLDQSQFIPDLWFQLLWEGLRIELEAAFVAGSLEGGCPRLVGDRSEMRDADELEPVSGDTCKFRQLGIALELEYRLFDDRLGIHFLSGLASGDSHAYGLAQTNDPSFQRTSSRDNPGDRTITTYQFHPDYRVDLILWRTLMRRVAGGYYFKPGVSYDFIHDPYGQRAGGRLDVIYSRATSPKQTWGNDGNLGLEMDLSLYYRSEDGPDPLDGFYGLVQWGILFPFGGLDYPDELSGAPSLSKNAMIFRGVAGIAF